MTRISGLHIRREALLLLMSDSAVIALGLLAAIALQSRKAASLPQNLYRPGVAVHVALIVLICDLALYYNGLYDLRESRRRATVFVGVLRSTVIVPVVLGCLYFAEPRLRLGPETGLWPGTIVLGLLLSWRLLLSETGRFLNRFDRVLIVGTGSAGVSLVHEILSRPELNMKVVGFLDERGENIGKSLVNPTILGQVSEMEKIVARERVDRVVLSLVERRGFTPIRQLLRLKFAGVSVEDAHSVYEKITGRILLEHLSPSWLIFSDGFHKSGFLLAAKRTIDVVASLFSLVVTLPLMGIVAIAIWAETGTPILFRQRRVGLSGEQFELLKFRSMYHNAELHGPSWAAEGDARITGVGRIIRKYRIDELPQFLNVLRGEMSLVGPRPEQPHFCELLQNEIPLFFERHSLRPGITGWAQIKYQYGSTAEEAKRKLEFDLFYIKRLSLAFDLAIILETAKVILSGRGAR
jgi:sugar transferase (PEP-CTERM system associated)